MSGHTHRPGWLHTCLHGAVAFALALLLWYSGLLQGIEAKTFDLRASLAAKPSPATGAIVLVAVDQPSLDWVTENMGIVWPWPRELFGAVLDNCRRRGAKAVGIDVLFTEYSAAGVADDNALVRSIERAGPVALGSVFPTNDPARFSTWPDAIPRPKLHFQVSGQGEAVLPRYPRATLPISEIGSAAPVLCNVHHNADADGIYRRVHPFVLFAGAPLPTLGIGVYLAANPQVEITVDRDRILLGDRTIPLDGAGSTILRYRGPQKTHAMFSAASLIRQEFQIKNGEMDAAEVERDLADKYVLFGFTAPGLFDLRPSPTDGVFSGMEINATMLDNLLAGDFIRSLPGIWNVGLVAAFTLLTLLLLSLLTSLPGRILGALGLMGLPLPVSLLFYHQGFDFTLVPVQVAVVTALSLSLAQGYFMTMGRERFIRHSFKHYLSPVVIDQLLSQPERLKLGGERKELTMFFSDLQGFTRMSEGLEPEELIHMLNEYLTEMTDIILQEGGTLDKFVGDAIVAFWNAPLDTPAHAEQAVRAALRCQERLQAMRPDFAARYGKELIMRIGINTGHAVVGNMGSTSRFDYTVLGDAVNLAARLEGANKYFGTHTMISQATRSRLGSDFYCRELGRIKVVGRREPVTVFEPLSAASWATGDYAAFARGLQLFYAGRFAEARTDFARSMTTDPAAAAYMNLCQTMQAKPPADWDGVFVLGAK